MKLLLFVFKSVSNKLFPYSNSTGNQQISNHWTNKYLLHKKKKLQTVTNATQINNNNNNNSNEYNQKKKSKSTQLN